MSEEIKIIIQFAIYPLLTALVGVIVFFYHRDIKETHTSIDREGEEREKAINHTSENVGKIFDILRENNILLGKIDGRLDSQERICNIRHRSWDGAERRIP